METPENEVQKPRNYLEDLKKNCDQEEQRIKAELEKIGYPGTWQECMTSEPDIDQSQSQLSHIIELRKNCIELAKQQKLLRDTIIVGPARLAENVDALEQLLINNREYDIYQRGGRLVRIIKNHTVSKSKKNKNMYHQDATIIKEINEPFLTLLCTRIGHFIKEDKDFQRVDCPEKLAKYLLAQGEWKIPTLNGIIHAPTLRADDSILYLPGYDKKSGLFLLAEQDSFGTIPDKPTQEQALTALNILLYPLKDFPFANDESRSVAIAAIMTALVRRSLPSAPLFGFSAPKMASGKSLLADIVSLIAIGKVNSVIPQVDTETEERKRILSMLGEGHAIFCYDNIQEPFGSAALCSVLTQGGYKDRVLGISETRTVPTNATFLATGNNLTFVGDITTRTLLCKLDPEMERPEERKFDIIDIRQYVLDNREKLVSCALTIPVAYQAAGKPNQNIPRFGRFEEWSDRVRSPLVWLGLADPYISRKAIETADPERHALGKLLAAWHDLFGDEAYTVRDIVDRVIRNNHSPKYQALQDAMHELLADGKDTINHRSLAKRFSYFKGRIEHGYRLEQGTPEHGTSRWRVKNLPTRSDDNG